MIGRRQFCLTALAGLIAPGVRTAMAEPATQSFLAELEASLPAKMTLPPEFRQALQWMEANGCVHTYRSGNGRFASAYPGNPQATSIYFTPAHPDHAAFWGGITEEASRRLAPILRVGGDGTYVALWRDDNDAMHCVYLGSGSGSTLMCLAARSPLDMLRLMAIGYEELCWPEQFAKTPAEAAAENQFREGAPPVPEAFRAFLVSTFATTIPRTAAEIAPPIAEMGDASSEDPFWNWIQREQATPAKSEPPK